MYANHCTCTLSAFFIESMKLCSLPQCIFAVWARAHSSYATGRLFVPLSQIRVLKGLCLLSHLLKRERQGLQRLKIYRTSSTQAQKWSKALGWISPQVISFKKLSFGRGFISLLMKNTPLFFSAAGHSVWATKWPEKFWLITNSWNIEFGKFEYHSLNSFNRKIS